MRTDVWRRGLGIALALGLLAAGAAAAGEPLVREGRPFHWSERMEAGEVLEIRTLNGRIEAGPASGSKVEVEAERWTRGDDGERVKIEVKEIDGRTVIRARYPNTLFAINADDVVVNFTVRVPRGVDLKLSTVNGAIVAKDLENRVRARTVNGAIRIDTREEARARTVNGSITARATPRSGGMSFRTVNGSVRLEMPSDASAELEAHTFHGTITSDFPARYRRRSFLGRSLKGRLGDGDTEVKVTTVNGSIRFTQI
jgi:DUF4097 and DUF4098 domain-containing protein YvlB